jgi:hypothetical protein
LEELSFVRGSDDKPTGLPRPTMDQAAEIYRAMLAASPTPPEPDEGMVGWKWFAKKGGWV